MDEGQLLLLWPGEVRRKREGDFGQIGPALLAGTNNSDQSIKEISSTSYYYSSMLVQNAFLFNVIGLTERPNIILEQKSSQMALFYWQFA